MDLRMQYATTSDGVRIAFGTAGSGPWIVRAPSLPFSHCQLEWANGSRFFDRLTDNWSVVQFDTRGVGLSDRNVDDLSLDARIKDLEAVVEKLGLDTFALHAMGWSGPMAITYVLRNPGRVSHLILDDSQARIRDFMNIPQMRALDQLTGEWESFLEYLVFTIYGRGRDDAGPIIEYFKQCTTQEGAKRIFAAVRGDDVMDLLPDVSVPTLILQHAGMSSQNVDNAREMAARIPEARLVLLEGRATDDTDRIISAIADLLGTEPAADRHEASHPHPHFAPSGVRTILFTDIVDHTQMMRRLGDEGGRDVLREHERITREVLAANGGDEVKSMGDGFMASFSSVSGAVECAIQLQRAFAAQGGEAINVRIGLNAGEPIEEGGDLFGATVIQASRIAGQAEGGEILASEVVRALCAGKNFMFTDRGDVLLRGFEDPVRLYGVRWRE
jgi:class 3 adenylate cyclase